jgi:hypothetical protein
MTVAREVNPEETSLALRVRIQTPAGAVHYFLRTSFIPWHISLAGAPFSQPTPSISM